MGLGFEVAVSMTYGRMHLALILVKDTVRRIPTWMVVSMRDAPSVVLSMLMSVAM